MIIRYTIALQHLTRVNDVHCDETHRYPQRETLWLPFTPAVRARFALMRLQEHLTIAGRVPRRSRSCVRTAENSGSRVTVNASSLVEWNSTGIRSNLRCQTESQWDARSKSRVSLSASTWLIKAKISERAKLQIGKSHSVPMSVL